MQDYCSPKPAKFRFKRDSLRDKFVLRKISFGNNEVQMGMELQVFTKSMKDSNKSYIFALDIFFKNNDEQSIRILTLFQSLRVVLKIAGTVKTIC